MNILENMSTEQLREYAMELLGRMSADEASKAIKEIMERRDQKRK